MGDAIYASEIVVPFTTERKDDKGEVLPSDVPVIAGTLQPMNRFERVAWFRAGEDPQADHPALAAKLLVDHIKTWSLTGPITADEIARLRDPILESLLLAVILTTEARRKNS
jgi:hypothetical protein